MAREQRLAVHGPAGLQVVEHGIKRAAASGSSEAMSGRSECGDFIMAETRRERITIRGEIIR